MLIVHKQVKRCLLNHLFSLSLLGSARDAAQVCVQRLFGPLLAGHADGGALQRRPEPHPGQPQRQLLLQAGRNGEGIDYCGMRTSIRAGGS